MISNKFGQSIKILKSDNGREFCNKQMDEYLASRGIKRETTEPYTPEQNGKAERDNRTIVESARTMIHAKNLPLSLWAEAVNCAVYVLNRTMWSSDTVTPYEMRVGKAPDLRHLRIFGSEAFAYIPKQFTQKLDARAQKTIFVGYKDNSAIYRLYNPVTKRVSEARDVFNERIGKVSTQMEPKNEEDKDEIVLQLPEKEIEREEIEDETPQDAAAVRVDDAAERAENLPVNPRVLRNRANFKTPRRYDADIAEYTIPNTYQEATNSTEATQ